MSLSIVHGLKAILQRPQEPVGPAQRFDCFSFDQPGLIELEQGRQQRPFPQRRTLTAAYQLKSLNDELDLANSPRPELDVLRHVPARHLLCDQRLHLAERPKYPEIQIAPIDERREDLIEELFLVASTGHQSSFQIGITFPVTAVLDEIALQRRYADR